MNQTPNDDRQAQLDEAPTALEDLSTNHLRMRCLFAAIRDAVIGIEVRGGEPAAVDFSAPEAVAGQTVRLDGEERTFLIELLGIVEMLRKGSQVGAPAEGGAE